MLGHEACFTVGIPIHPKDIRNGGGQGSLQANKVLPHQTGKTIMDLPLCTGALTR